VIYKTIAILGIGTLGGFIANAIQNIETVEDLIFIDPDTIEEKNLKNTIYEKEHLFKNKVDALTEIIRKKNRNITTISMNEKYIEGKTKIPKCDLVLDCRDYTYDRGKEIDARLYISSRYLMVDTRKNIEYKVKQEGRYLVELTKEDLRYASATVAMLIHNGTIKSLIDRQCVQKYELDHTKHIERDEYDIVYENVCGENKFINLPDKIVPILKANKKSDVDVFIGSRLFPLDKIKIPKNTLQNSCDIVLNFSKVVSNQKTFNNFVISISEINNQITIELIPETGAA
jgi:hypothetical protein